MMTVFTTHVKSSAGYNIKNSLVIIVYKNMTKIYILSLISVYAEFQGFLSFFVAFFSLTNVCSLYKIRVN